MILSRLGLSALVAILAHTHSGAAGGGSTPVSIAHWSYRFLERCETKGVLVRLGDGIKPFTRSEMAAALRRVGENHERLSKVEQSELDLLRREFDLEDAASSTGSPAADRSGGSALARVHRGEPLVGYSAPQGELFADLLLRHQIDVHSGLNRAGSEQVYRNGLGGVLWGEAWERVGFRIAFLQTREQGTRSYRIRDDVFERRLEVPQLKGNIADFHEGTAALFFSPLPDLMVEVGKGQASWGPAARDNLGLSDNAPAFDMIRLRGQFGILKLVSIAGALRPCPDRPDSPQCAGVGDSSASYLVNGVRRPLERGKYLAAHRVEASLFDWLDVGLHEVLVYGDRPPQPTYLNPVMFYWAAQSYQGDKDNLMMGIDFDLHPGNGMKFHLAYVVDDLKKLRIFSDDFANKFSLQTGLLWVDPAGLRDTDLRAEYVRIEPWIYTHKFPINTFRHFDSPLGHSLGPNADRLELAASRRFNRDLSLGANLSRTRHGSNEILEDGTVLNVGGDLHRGWRPLDDRESKEFLAGNLHVWTRLSLNLEWRVRPALGVAVGYAHEWGTNVPLPPRWRPNIALESRTGYGDGSSRDVSFDLRYGYF